MSKKLRFLRLFVTSSKDKFLLNFFNSLYLLDAATFKLQVKKNLMSELGKIFVAISLPSIQDFLFFFEKLIWNFFRIFLIDLILRKIDQIVIKYGGRIYLCKDSLTNASDFKKMNTGFENSDFKKIRKIKKRFFNSEQSNRLQI